MSNNKYPYNLVIFDLDGTLADTLPDIQQAYTLLAKEYNFKQPTREDITQWIGKGQPIAVARCLADNLINQQTHDNYDQFYQEVMAKQLEYYHQVGNSYAKLFPGVKETLLYLKKKGIQLAICTNKPHSLIPSFLQDFALDGIFDYCLGQGKLAKNKPDGLPITFLINKFATTPTTTLMIGDSDNDILAGQNAGADTVAVTYGYYPHDKLTALQPTYIIDHIAQLKQLFTGK